GSKASYRRWTARPGDGVLFSLVRPRPSGRRGRHRRRALAITLASRPFHGGTTSPLPAIPRPPDAEEGWGKDQAAAGRIAHPDSDRRPVPRSMRSILPATRASRRGGSAAAGR